MVRRDLCRVLQSVVVPHLPEAAHGVATVLVGRGEVRSFVSMTVASLMSNTPVKRGYLDVIADLVVAAALVGRALVDGVPPPLRCHFPSLCCSAGLPPTLGPRRPLVFTLVPRSRETWRVISMNKNKNVSIAETPPLHSPRTAPDVWLSSAETACTWPGLRAPPCCSHALRVSTQAKQGRFRRQVTTDARHAPLTPVRARRRSTDQSNRRKA